MCIRDRGLPDDLFYRSDDQVQVVEPVKHSGGVCRMLQRYSPQRWQHRDHHAVESTPVPSEQQRADAFRLAAGRFSEALLLRICELNEPGQRSEAVVEQLRQLDSGVLKTILLHRELWPPKA